MVPCRVDITTLAWAVRGSRQTITLILTTKGFQLQNGGIVPLDVGNGVTDTAATVVQNVGSWTMLSFTYSGTAVTVYENATAGGSAAFVGPVATATNSLSFCFNPAYSGDFYAGMIAGFAIYNRALNSGEVATINGL